MSSPSLPVIDIHTHLAGLGHGGTGCFISARKFNSVLFRIMRRKLGIQNAHRKGRLDEAYLERLHWDVTAAAECGALAACVLFAHERVYTDAGEPQAAQELYVPNDYVFSVCERFRGRFLPAISVHPYRRDALEETQKWLERGAVAMKWLPNSQGMDPRDRRCLPLYDLLAARKIPLIVHTGGEHVVSVTRVELGNPAVMRPALERGVTVVIAHCGTNSVWFDTNWLPVFCEMARQYPNCWGDTSALNTPGRLRWLPRLLREEGVVEKLLHGSDYPVPPLAWCSLFRLGWSRTRQFARIQSYLARDVALKRAHGCPEIVFTNAARVLGLERLRRWGVN